MPERDDDLSLSEILEAVPELERTLEPGSQGRDVARLQHDLKRGGIDPGPIDGIFGDRTGAAVEAFCTRHELSGPPVDREVWAKVIEVAALERFDDLRRAAEELEKRAAEYRTRANDLEEEAATQRDEHRLEAGARMEEAGEIWLEGASAWELAAELWIEAAHVGEPFDAGDDGWRAYARWCRATDASRLFAGRARTALGEANEDLDAAGSTDHGPRIAAARAEARARAAH